MGKGVGRFNPNYTANPARCLAEVLESREISQAELSRRSGLSEKLISEIIAGKNPITAKTAVALEKALDVSAKIWFGMQNERDLFMARKEQEEAPARAAG